MDDVTRLRLLWADGDILHGVHLEHDHYVVFKSPTTERVCSASDVEPCVYSVTCKMCAGTGTVAPTFGGNTCDDCDGEGVVERVPDRLIGPGSEWFHPRIEESLWQTLSTPSELRDNGWMLVRAVPPTPEETP